MSVVVHRQAHSLVWSGAGEHRMQRTYASGHTLLDHLGEQPQSAISTPLRHPRRIATIAWVQVEHGDDAVTVTVGCLEDGFYVADDGTGFSADELDEVFSLSASTAAAGTGLGLSIVEMLAESEGWSVDVTESIEGGTRIDITGVTVPD